MRQMLVAVLILLFTAAPVSAQERAIPLVNYRSYCAIDDSCVINLEEEPILIQYFHNCGARPSQILSRNLTLNQGQIYIEQLANGRLNTIAFHDVAGQDQNGTTYSVQLSKQIFGINTNKATLLTFTITDPTYSLSYVHTGYQNTVGGFSAGNYTHWDCHSMLD